MFTRFLSALSVLALSGCATPSTTPSPVPSDREVAAYVTAHWDDFERRFAWLSGREGQSASLLSVTNVDCQPDGGDASCTFTARGRFGDGVIQRRSIDSLFQRQPDGSIEQLIPVLPA